MVEQNKKKEDSLIYPVGDGGGCIWEVVVD